MSPLGSEKKSVREGGPGLGERTQGAARTSARAGWEGCVSGSELRETATCRGCMRTFWRLRGNGGLAGGAEGGGAGEEAEQRSRWSSSVFSACQRGDKSERRTLSSRLLARGRPFKLLLFCIPSHAIGPPPSSSGARRTPSPYVLSRHGHLVASNDASRSLEILLCVFLQARRRSTRTSTTWVDITHQNKT